MRLSTKRNRAFLALSIAAAIVVAFFACTQDTPVTGPTIPLSAKLPPGARYLASSRAAAAMSQTTWAADIHREAMKDFIDHRAEWLGKDGETAEGWCRAAFRLTMKYAERVERMAGMSLSQEQLSRFVRDGIARTPHCAGINPMNLFGRSVNALSLTAMADGDTTTDAFIPYLYVMQDAIANSTDPSPAGVASAANSVISNAGGLSDADLMVLTTTANFAVSSYQTWTDYGSAGGFGGIELQTSIFRGNPFWDAVKKVAGVDLVMCATGGLDWWFKGPKTWQVFAGGCVLWGVGSSIGALVAL